ncbi:LuxR family two component transcriptional regulator [Larkinella arboricola]|uniref:LuxR family two component transcriptional regulator n=1 Tax=Larkinella arboricola TaxID=643671 RepID=A0A327WFG0_LARAB|nr:response regulator transcription factor [Larkinella arboricola]RAJ90029.1 LuxR family two component transcriptional regulator [Larkinella arboricola]
METIKVLIADDHPIFLMGLKEVIETDHDLAVVAGAPNGQEAVRLTQLHQPHVVVLDIDMPRLNGLQAAEQLLQRLPTLPIILLTMHKERDPFMRALEIGISGYVLKENAVSDIVHAIRMVQSGQPYLSPEMSSYLLKRSTKTLRPTTAATQGTDPLAPLSPAERRVLELVAQYKSSQEIADALFISEKTVFNHRANMAFKLHLSGKNSLLRFALEHLR